jgi:hypothetical protein
MSSLPVEALIGLKVTHWYDFTRFQSELRPLFKRLEACPEFLKRDVLPILSIISNSNEWIKCKMIYRKDNHFIPIHQGKN